MRNPGRIYQILSAVVVIIIILLNVTECHAQGWSVKMGVGGVMPWRRSYADVELRYRIAPRYSLSMEAEVSSDASNVAPKLVVDLYSWLSVEAAFGWGHIWKKDGCSDHNFHTYSIGLMWNRSLGEHWGIYAGPSMYWRSYQSHIGFHKGTLRLCTGIAYRF